MADEEKKSRLAAAKKKLRQSQKSSHINSTSFTNKTGFSVKKNFHFSGSLKPMDSNISTEHNTSESQKNISLSTLSISSLTSNSSEATNQNDQSPQQLNGLSDKKAFELTQQNNISSILSLKNQHSNSQNFETSFSSPNFSTSSSFTQTSLSLKSENNMLPPTNSHVKNCITYINDESSKPNMNKKEGNQNTFEIRVRSIEDMRPNDLESLRNQIKLHKETMSFLMNEKEELTRTCNQTQKLADSRQDEIEDLAAKLKQQRELNKNLEKRHSSINSSIRNLEANNLNLNRTVDQLKMENYQNKKQREELYEKNLELQVQIQTEKQKVNNFETEEARLKEELKQLKLSQVRPGSNVEMQIEAYIREKNELQIKLEIHETTIKNLSRDKEKQTTQFENLTKQLQTNIKELLSKNERLVNEKDELKGTNDLLALDLTSLKRKEAEMREDNVKTHEEKMRLQVAMEELRRQMNLVIKQLNAKDEDYSQLRELIIEKEEVILALEQKLTHVSHHTDVDEKQKNIILSEAKGRLQDEEHKNKQLQKVVTLQEEEIKNFKATIEDKIKYISELEASLNSLTSLNKSSIRQDKRGKEEGEILQSSSNEEENNRLAHLFKLKIPLIENLQNELTSAQDAINALTSQNSLLKLQLSDPTASFHESFMNEFENKHKKEKTALQEQLKEALKLRDLYKQQADHLSQDLAHQAPATLNGDVVSKEHFEALQHVMRQLEEKLSRVMRDKANLLDDSERLEHTVTQLQGENDTIGEYVTLYHQQRSLMNQRLLERDSFIEQLKRERSEFESKLNKLQILLFKHIGKSKKLSSGMNGREAGEGKRIIDKFVLDPETGEKVLVGQVEDEDWPDLDSDSSENEEIISKPTIPQNQPLDSLVSEKDDSTFKEIIEIIKDISLSSPSSLSSSPSSSPSRTQELFRLRFNCKNCSGNIKVV